LIDIITTIEPNLIFEYNNTFLSNDRKMATTATLTAVPSPGTTNYSSNIDSSKPKIEENIISAIAKKSGQYPQQSPMKSSNKIANDDGVTKTDSFNRSTSTFRIPKIGR
jgi:hypothetical protein